MVLPGLSGLDLATAVREEYPRIRTLRCSGWSDDSRLLDGVRKAEVAFLRKPFEREELLGKVREVLGG